jgi:hypothetical protein
MTEAETRRPNFMLLGAAKCGTTSLAYYLSQHPDLFFSEPKEPVFFEAEYERGLEFYWNQYFRNWNGEAAIGEGRVYNLFLPFVPARIFESVPTARLIALLRDPVERAYSHWWHRYSRGLETLPFGDAIGENLSEPRGAERFAGEEGAKRWREGLINLGVATRYRLYVDLGFYAEQLGRYRERFDPSRIKVVFHEDLSRDPAAVTREVWSFLGVDPSGRLGDAAPRNVRRETVRGPVAARLLQIAQASRLRTWIPSRWRPRLRAWLPEREAERPLLDPDTRRSLASCFRPHNERLERLVGRDLSSWGDPTSGSAKS